MPQPSKSNPENDPSPAHSWLVERVYEPKRERTIELVKRSVDALLERKERISLASLAAISKTLDPENRGVSESAILNNQEARTYYEQHRSWRGSSRKRVKPSVATLSVQLGTVKLDRDEQQVRQRYLRMSKEILVQRFIAVERLHAQEHERWLTQQDEALTWRLRAEAAETRLKKSVTKTQ